MSDLPGDQLDAAAEEVERSSVIAANLAVAAEVDNLSTRAGRVDILVNNAGLQHVSPIETFPAERWDTIIAVMLTAPFLLTKALVPGMYETGWGRIINIASVHALVASPFKVAYVSAKHGLLGMTRTIALEAAEHSQDVTAHAICPSYVSTALVEHQIEEQAKVHQIDRERVVEDVLLEHNAIKRLIAPEEIAAAVEWLCGPLAWTMTGAALTMDAGWLAH